METSRKDVTDKQFDFLHKLGSLLYTPIGWVEEKLGLFAAMPFGFMYTLALACTPAFVVATVFALPLDAVSAVSIVIVSILILLGFPRSHIEDGG